MKANTSIFVICLLLHINIFGQREGITLTFSGIDNASPRQLDSIEIQNRSREGSIKLIWPDTVFTIYFVNIEENIYSNESFLVRQNFPNPVLNRTTFSIYIPIEDNVSLLIYDALGRLMYQSESVLNSGQHTFSFTPGNSNLYLMSAIYQGRRAGIKIVNLNTQASHSAYLEYLGSGNLPASNTLFKKVQDLNFNFGDELLYIGYSGNQQSGILDHPEESKSYNFQFATNIPCPGTPTVDYDGKIYNTIQIYSQCWLKENLNVGNSIKGIYDMSNDGLIEKYCYDDLESNCDLYGGLYQWQEMMQYSEIPGAQGICPPGWHIPTDEEWKVLEGSVDSQFKIGNPEWDLEQIYRGFDADTNLQSTYGWFGGLNGVDLFGFTALPGGVRVLTAPHFINMTVVSGWWTSESWGNFQKWDRAIRAFWGGGVARYHSDRKYGNSVRCLMDD